MHLIRAATLTVSQIGIAVDHYCRWLNYEIVETGTVPKELADSWDAPKTAGQNYAVLRPSSKTSVFLRLIEQPPRRDYKPLRTYGWAAIEICTQDTQIVNARMIDSPFEIIGPPKTLDGLPTILPMQVKGVNGEIVFLTQIKDEHPEVGLARADSLIDRLFILVMACEDMASTCNWLESHLLLHQAEKMEINYTMINKAFGLPDGSKHKLRTLKHEQNIFLEVDQYPVHAQTRRSHAGMLPPAFAIASFIHPNFTSICDVNEKNWIKPPQQQHGTIYNHNRSATLKTPEGALIEIIEG